MNCVALQGIRGGVGTSSLVAGLALAAREQGARVLAVDLCHDNLLGIHLGLPHADARGWSRLADPAREWRSALYHYEEGLDLLPHGGQPGASAGEWLQALDGCIGPSRLIILEDPPQTPGISEIPRECAGSGFEDWRGFAGDWRRGMGEILASAAERILAITEMITAPKNGRKSRVD